MKKVYVILAIFLLALFLLWIGKSRFLNGQKVTTKKTIQSTVETQTKKAGAKQTTPVRVAPTTKGTKPKK